MSAKPLLVLLLGISALSVAGCEEEGPAERAGAEIDDALSEAQDRLEAAGEEVDEAADEIRDALEDN